MSTGRVIRLIEEDDGSWSAIDEETGVASQGETREEALTMLDEAVALHTGQAGDPVTDEGLRELGLDPDSTPDEPGVPDAPWFGNATSSPDCTTGTRNLRHHATRDRRAVRGQRLPGMVPVDRQPSLG